MTFSLTHVDLLEATVECGVEKGMGAAIPFTVFYMPVPLPEEDEPVNVFIMVGGDGFGELCNESPFLQALPCSAMLRHAPPCSASCHNCLLLVLGGCGLQQQQEGS